MEGMSERRRVGLDRVGGHRPIFWYDYSNDEKIFIEIHHCLWMAPDRQWLTQQPTKNMRPQQREVWRGGATSGRCVGNVIPLFGQIIDQQRKKEEEIHHGIKWP